MRRQVLLVVVLVCFVFVPIAMASDGCAGPGMMGAAPCASPCIATSLASGDTILAVVAALPMATSVRLSTVPLKTPDGPPKFLSF